MLPFFFLYLNRLIVLKHFGYKYSNSKKNGYGILEIKLAKIRAPFRILLPAYLRVSPSSQEFDGDPSGDKFVGETSPTF
jgi:hypothetical protein